MLLDLPIRHRGIMVAPLLGRIDIDRYLATGKIGQVICGGENYGGARECDFDWVKDLGRQCLSHHVRFAFIETGTAFVKDGQRYRVATKKMQSRLAYKSKASVQGKRIEFVLYDAHGKKLEPERLHVPHYRRDCRYCGSRSICNGCSDCGRCVGGDVTLMEMEEHDRNYLKKGARK